MITNDDTILHAHPVFQLNALVSIENRQPGLLQELSVADLSKFSREERLELAHMRAFFELLSANVLKFLGRL